MVRCSRSTSVAVGLLAFSTPAAELLENGDFEGQWSPLKSEWQTGSAEGQVPEEWSDVSTWSGASTRYSRIVGAGGGHALRLEMTRAATAHSRLQLRSGFSVTMEAGKAYTVRAKLRSPTRTTAFLDIRQHQPPRIQFWKVAVQATQEWRELEFVVEPEESGIARFFVWFSSVGTVEVDGLSLRELADDAKPPAKPPIEIDGARCVPTRGDLIRRSDIIAMYPESRAERIKKYRIDVVAWGGQLLASEKNIANRRKLIASAHAAGVRLHAVDCALVQEGGRAVVCQGDRSFPNVKLFWQLRRDNAGTLARLTELGIDMNRDTVLSIDGKWQPVPWLRKRWRIPLASAYSPTARKWFLAQMDAIAATGPSALHFDEPGMGAYGLTLPDPGDFSVHAMAAFREWLRKRPPEVWQQAGIETLDGFDYRQFIIARGTAPKRAPLWREFVRFQLFTTAAHVRELRDRVRKKVGKSIPLSMNANAGSWLKLPFLDVQDYATTEVRHSAKTLRPPIAPLLVYKLADAIAQPVASTAMGNDWYQMKEDQHPILVSSWLAMGYALGHHLMMPCKAWVMDPVKGSDTYRPVTDHYACMAHFIKSVAGLLDKHEPVSAVAVAVSCDAIEHQAQALTRLTQRLANRNIPFAMSIEGNDLLARRVSADDIAGCSAVIIAGPSLFPAEAQERLRAASGDRAIVPYYGGRLPSFLPRPLRVEGADGVWVLPRAVPGDTAAPAVLHLLNREYDPEARAMVAKDDFTVTVDARLFSNRQLTKATLYQPRLLETLPEDGHVTLRQELAVKQNSSLVEVRVPRLSLWGIAELR